MSDNIITEFDNRIALIIQTAFVSEQLLVMVQWYRPYMVAFGSGVESIILRGWSWEVSVYSRTSSSSTEWTLYNIVQWSPRPGRLQLKPEPCLCQSVVTSSIGHSRTTAHHHQWKHPVMFIKWSEYSDKRIHVSEEQWRLANSVKSLVNQGLIGLLKYWFFLTYQQTNI